MKIVSWNVNGIRACVRHGFLDWLNAEKPDVLCLQETKAHPDQLDESLRSPPGYTTYWSAAKKKGYSGVSLFVKNPVLRTVEGIGSQEFDDEGRTLICEFDDFYLVNGYFPNGQPDLGRVPFKLKYSDTVEAKALSLKAQSGKPVVICGDYNTAHREIDLARPKENEGNTGFLPQERAWIDRHLENGFIDAFREFEPGPGHYTWWSYRAGARRRNVGWRIDYFFITPELKDRLLKCYHQPQVIGSDHCPVVLEMA